LVKENTSVELKLAWAWPSLVFAVTRIQTKKNEWKVDLYFAGYFITLGIGNLIRRAVDIMERKNK
jgi:hypothetical protein